MHFTRLFAGYLLFALLLPFSAFAADFTLDNVRSEIKQKFSKVSHLSNDDLRQLMKTSEEVLILDVREEREYKVSHISGALRVSPGIWSSTFFNRFKSHIENKIIVFYCSVGQRSSKLANRLQGKLKDLGAKAIYNLDGGIFAWHNQSLKLKNFRGPTHYVHPFNSRWSQLIDNQDLIRTTYQKNQGKKN